MKEINTKMNDVFCVDVMDGLRSLKDNTVDLIITSPPYNNWRNRRTQSSRENYWKRTNIVYENHDDKMSDKDYMQWQINIINECIRVLKPTGTMCYNHKDRIFNFEVLSPLVWILQSKAIIRQRITWDRCGMQARTKVRFYRVEEDIYVLGKQAKGFFWNKNAARYLSVWRISPSRNDGHICAFPPEIPKRCIEAFTEEGMLVLDPFAGSGTTLAVAKEMKRKYLGFDNSESCVSMAREKINGG